MESDGAEPRPARDRYCEYFAAAMKEHGASFAGLGRTTGTDRMQISAAAKGRQHANHKLLPTMELVTALDDALHADGRLLGLWRLAVMEDTAIRINLTDSRHSPEPGRTVDVTEGVRKTNRRKFFERMGELSAAAVLEATDHVDGQLRGARPKITTLAEAETALSVLDRDKWAVDPAILFPPGYSAWWSVEEMLERRVHPKYLKRLTLLAGQLSAGLSTVSRFGGDEKFGRIFADIAEQHANAAGEPLLSARVAIMQAATARHSGQWAVAADIAAAGQRLALPEDRARLAAYEAEAAAAVGEFSRATEAIGVMRAGMDAAMAPDSHAHWNGAEEVLYIALTAARIPGSGAEAVARGTEAATTFVRDAQGTGLAYVAIAYGHLDGDHPAPDAAASAGLAALDAVASVPNATVHRRVQTLANTLSRWAGEEPLVDKLDRRLV